MRVPSRGRPDPERGAVAVLAAIMITVLLVIGGLVIDFGLVRMDRKTNRAAADAAVTAGLLAANNGTGDVYNSTAVCTALAFLKSNRPLLSGLPDGDCASVDPSKICNPGDASSAVGYSGTVTSAGKRFEVWIKMPYSLSDTTTGGAFADESLSTLASDPGETTQQGCDQLGVVIKEYTTPGLGALVHSGELASRVRSVGRVKVGNGDPAPALILLERTRCGVLSVGSAGSSSRIRVYGSSTSPGTIHSDSNATDSQCGTGSGQQLMQGKQNDGIAAYGGSNGTSGLITSVATQNGRAADVVSDGSQRVYGTTALNETSSGTTQAVTGRKLVSRKPVDKRYLPGVTSGIRSSSTEWAKNHTSPAGYTRYGCPSAGDMTAMSGLPSTASVYIDCPGGGGIGLTGTIGAGTIYFHGAVKGGVLRMPNAKRVYIDNTDNSGAKASSDALSLSGGNGFCVRSLSCLPTTPSIDRCSPSPTADVAAKAQVFVRRGTMAGTGGLLRMCNTTVVMLGGDVGDDTPSNPGGCLPTSVGIAPRDNPCTGPNATSSAGDGSVATGSSVDWTAPNAYSDMTAAGLSVSQQQALWSAGEDLALWTETYGDGPTFKMSGSSSMNVSGVFMVPNALPFTVGGSSNQNLTDAQFVVRSFAVDGGAVLTMRVDPNNVVGLPSLYDFRMVR